MVSGVGGMGCSRTPKSFDLLKIRAKSLKIWAKLPLKLVCFQKLAPNVCRKNTKTHEDFLFEVLSKKDLREKFCRHMSYKKLFGKFGEIRAKTLRTSKYLPAPKPMATVKLYENITPLGFVHMLCTLTTSLVQDEYCGTQKF